MLHVNIVKFEIAMAFLVSKPKNIMEKGTTTPPPPRPAMENKESKMAINTVPRISQAKIGNKGLCSHIKSLLQKK